MGIGVAPGPGDCLARDLQVLEQPPDRVGPTVGPAADRQHRTTDLVIVRADGSLKPVVIPPLMVQPDLQERGRRFQSLEPHVPPGLTDDRRIRRARIEALHDGPPAHGLAGIAADEIAAVVVVAVDRGVHGDDRLELGRTADCRLQAHDAAPGYAGHAHSAVAPRLCGNPGQDLERIVALLGEVLVEQQAL